MLSMTLSQAQISEFRENGCVKLEGFLDEKMVERCREQYKWAFDHRSQNGGFLYGSRNNYNLISTIGTAVEKDAKENFLPFVKSGPFCEAAAQLCGSDRIWYYDFELMAKRQTEADEGGERPAVTACRWHQDTPLHSMEGEDLVNFWMPLEGNVPKASCLTFVKGSHKGPMFDNVFPTERDRVRISLPPIPDVTKLHEQGEVLPGTQTKIELAAWDLKLGDVIAFHGHALHGGANLVEGNDMSVHPFYEEPPKPPVLSLQRRTLVLRFFGERVVYRELCHPEGGALGKDGGNVKLEGHDDIGTDEDGGPIRITQPWLDGMKGEEPFWHSAAPRSTEYGYFHGFDQVHGEPPLQSPAE